MMQILRKLHFMAIFIASVGSSGCASVGVITSGAFPADVKTIAVVVVDFRSNFIGDGSTLRNTVEDSMISMLKRFGHDPLTRKDIDDLMEENNLDKTGATDADRAKAVTTFAAAEAILKVRVEVSRKKSWKKKMGTSILEGIGRLRGTADSTYDTSPAPDYEMKVKLTCRLVNKGRGVTIWNATTTARMPSFYDDDYEPAVESALGKLRRSNKAWGTSRVEHVSAHR